MKIKLSLLILSLQVFVVYSQSNITNYNWVSGVHRYDYTEATVNPNPVAPGKNVTWDFTSLASDPADSVTFQISGSTPFTVDFSNANVVWSEYRKADNNRTVLWHFYKNQFGFEFLGYGEVGVGTNVFSSGKTMLKFPFVFDSSFVDYYSSGGSYKSTVKYDGYGTLKLPNGTYTNVYRTTSKDSSSPTKVVYYYEWFDANRRIMFMEKQSNFSATYYLRTPNKTSVNKLESSSIDIQVYPNPSIGTFNINLSDATLNNSIKVYDITGQLILQDDSKLNYENLSIPVSGYYIVEVNIDGSLYYKKLVITK